jgi:hypothetical protein
MYRCTLAIASIGVSLRCADPLLVAQLRRRYTSFPAGEALHLTVQVTQAEAATLAAPGDPHVVLNGAIAQVAGPGFSGQLDAAAGQAQLEVAAAEPSAAIDYFLRVAYALLGFQSGGLLLHAAGIVRGAHGYLFLGPSGAGKTTVARLSPDDLVLNDDLVLLMPHEREWRVYATPFSNPSQVRPAAAASAPLAALFRLVQDARVYLEPVDAAQSFAELVAHVPLLALDPNNGPWLLGRVRAILAAAPLQRLHFLPDASFWPLVEAVGRHQRRELGLER